MGIVNLSDIKVTQIREIPTPGGNVLHALKGSEDSYNGFGEAYFSWIESGYIKAWKKHNQMVMNLIVPVGKVKFVFFDSEQNLFSEYVIGESNYSRITVPSGLWFGFQGLNSSKNLILNISNIPHDPNEADRVELSKIQYDWGVV
ncbi:dTDP-4-dehydrorhamnose 3,5-epimerase [Leptospira levettii]|uniref:dTDP-4-dehydrorhamnose 3,5-epimerase n=1 Tax=Leptospira levettii TaxID=2023178 RepID=UPI001FEFCEF6|nr:dTDP-4-dehydrorhamnose 3,5-epimerase [Leptospira levettii]